MSNAPHEPQPEHGTISSYIVGFILSIIFTLISYFLAVNKQAISGTTLLWVIMGLAVTQMIVQITFFLHLGRGPKPRWNLFFFASTVGIILIVVGGSIVIINNLHYNMLPTDQTKKLINDEGIYQIGGKKTGACQAQFTNHTITIKDGQVYPLHTEAGLCDTLTFKSEDKVTRDITFGTHHHNKAYAGETELLVRNGRNKTITLSESGTYLFYDHSQPEITGSFTVAP